ncbi:hypothetical protein KIL84_016953 [Mauremys mutica]|uniref:Uncharacterized protein n=1 Tax=Mauremys mutica TaxID=74926 RepID=A0A9D4AWY4_9SAUR|nr:hypothetical protein KIL84_016953 [Mauremys mutica]
MNVKVLIGCGNTERVWCQRPVLQEVNDFPLLSLPILSPRLSLKILFFHYIPCSMVTLLSLLKSCCSTLKEVLGTSAKPHLRSLADTWFPLKYSCSLCEQVPLNYPAWLWENRTPH